MILIHQRYRRTDRRTDRQTTCGGNTALCTIVHRAVIIVVLVVLGHSIVNTSRRVVSGDRKITDCIGFFSYFWSVFGFFSVFEIPTSVSVSVF